MKRILLAMSLLLCSFITSTVYSQCPTDNAGNLPYNNGWDASDNGGNGFNVWSRNLTNPGNGSQNGFFIGNSNSNGDGGPSSIGSSCWALYANSSQTASATRAFSNTLNIGGTLSFGMDNGWLDNGAVVGFGIQNAAGENLVEFYYIGGSNKYKINDNNNQTDTAFDFTDDGFTFTFSRTDANNYSLVATRLTNNQTINITGALKSPAGGKVPAQVRFFNFNAGGGNERNAFFNNLSITDNPTATASNVSGCAGSAITLVGSGLPSGGTGTFSIANPYTGPSTTYTYTYTAPNGCSTTSAPANVTVTPLTTNGSVNTSICQGQTYTWPANGQTYSTAQTNLTHVVGCNTATLNLTITPLSTPTVSLSSSDLDNTFAYGTSVTFTANAGNLAGGTATYDFKVNGTSVQNSASTSYVVNNLANGNQVSVSITVTGGTCLSTTTADSNVITNTVTGAFLSNIICVPTLPVINTIIRATVPSGVTGVLGYRFRVRNNVTNATVTLDRSVANFNLTMTNIYTYNTTFNVQVAAVVDGVEQPYSAVCVVTTPSIPLNQVGVGGVQCGGTLEALNTRIFANTVFGTQLYRFRVALSTAPTTYYYATSVFPSFRLTGVAGLPLTYGTSYLVSVQSEVDVNGTLTISAYSTECTVSTPAITVIVPSSSGQCGQTLAVINDRIFINSVPNATGYVYRLALASAPTVYYDFPSQFTNFRLTSVPGLPLTFETDYLLSVQAKVTIEGQDYFSSFSTPCPVRTPDFPTVGLQASQCSSGNEENPGPYQVTSNSEIIYSDFVSGASYEFVLQKVIDGVPTLDAPLTLIRPVNNFTLAMIEGVTPETDYLVFVKLNYYGQGPEGKDCSIQSPPSALPSSKIVAAGFTAKAYPNPFANNFMIDVATESQSTVTVKVYDMVGRLVDSRESKASNLNSLAIGEQYPSGVYNVVVTQDEEVRALRVVKR